MVHRPRTLTCFIAYSSPISSVLHLFKIVQLYFASMSFPLGFSFFNFFLFHFSIACISREIPNSADVIYRCEGGKQVQVVGKLVLRFDGML